MKRAESRRIQDGDIVNVHHTFANGDVVVYRAVIRFDDAGRSRLERIKSDDGRIARANVRYYSTFPIPGYLDWFMISALPVLLSRFVRVGSPIRRLMQSAPYSE